MPKFEIERKFLVIDDSFKESASDFIDIEQGYLSRRKESTVRIRVAGGKGFLTVKGITLGTRREEYEYEIPAEDARRMLMMCEGKIISKRRWLVPFDGHIWEVDEFKGSLAQLTVAEIELPLESASFRLPPFIGKEVTGDPEYYNSNLCF